MPNVPRLPLPESRGTPGGGLKLKPQLDMKLTRTAEVIL
jgi:hypothetical protein